MEPIACKTVIGQRQKIKLETQGAIICCHLKGLPCVLLPGLKNLIFLLTCLELDSEEDGLLSAHYIQNQRMRLNNLILKNKKHVLVRNIPGNPDHFRTVVCCVATDGRPL